MMIGRSLRLTLALCAVVVGCTLVSCGSKDEAAKTGEGSTPAATTTEAPAASEGGGTEGGGSASAPCALLSNEEASAILGMPTRQDGSSDKSCLIQPGEGVKGLFGGVAMTVMDNRTAFDMMTKVGDPVAGMGEQAILDPTGGLGIWKGGKGVVITLINPPTTMDIKAVLMKIGEKVAGRI